MNDWANILVVWPWFLRTASHLCCMVSGTCEQIGCCTTYHNSSAFLGFASEIAFLMSPHKFSIGLRSGSLHNVISLAWNQDGACFTGVFGVVVLNMTFSINDSITQTQQHACHDCWVCWFSISLPHLLVKYNFYQNQWLIWLVMLDCYYFDHNGVTFT